VDLAVAGSNPASPPFCPPISYILIGWTIDEGRCVVVICIDDRDGRYPIYARAASDRVIERISK
jgi:hypothetical protein